MKYTTSSQSIPQSSRADINSKIMSIVDSGNAQGITKEDVFNAYTGDGGLHGLEFNNYDSFHSFSEAKKEVENGQFFTPASISEQIVKSLKIGKSDLVADLCCGAGAFVNYVPVERNFYGADVDFKAVKVAKYLYPDAELVAEDIRFYNPEVKFDFVLGNPPFNLRWSVDGDEYYSQLYSCVKAAVLLKPGGVLAIVVPMSFLADEFSDKGMIESVEEHFNFITQIQLSNDTFKDMGVSSFPTKVIYFQKKSENIEGVKYDPKSFFDGDFISLHSEKLAPVLDQRTRLKSSLFLELNRATSENDDFQYRVNKLLFEVKAHPSIFEHYGRCEAYIERFLNQSKPDEMDWKEWEKKRITENKVLSYLKRVVALQDRKESDTIRLVKTNYGVKYKAYSRKATVRLNKLHKTKEWSFNDVVSGLATMPTDEYNRPVKRRSDLMNVQSIPFKRIGVDSKISRFVNAFRFVSPNDNKEYGLTAMQKEDMNKFLWKPYAECNWQQGCGKTPAAYSWMKFQQKNTNIKNVFVISPAISINLTWTNFLNINKVDFKTIKSLNDIESIKPGQVVLLSLTMLTKYQRFIKRFVKMHSQKIGLVFDESDEITNHTSKRTKAVLSCFRKCKVKFLATGTTTRNNINELYSQLELMYNNSVNMLCEAPVYYKEKYVKTKGTVITEESNPYWNTPFPAYSGNLVFKRCFSPGKASVFGIEKQNQDIYNKESLLSLIEKSISTRKFKEIVGDNKYSIITHRLEQSSSEKALYKIIIEEFYSMVRNYFASTGSSRKDSMLRIIQQINLLIKASSVPQSFKEYLSDGSMPVKFSKVRNMVQEWDDEKIAIGCTTLEGVTRYRAMLQDSFPSRPLFVITGAVNFKQRQIIIAEFQATKDGILLSTQQSLKSSVNIPTCNKVIIESLPWNIPKLEQYYYRFIRFDSLDTKEIHLVTYDNTIEQNVLALLLSKERINDFVKTLEFREEADVFEEFDVSLDIFNSLITKDYDDEGNVSIKWGQQMVS